MKFSRRSSVSIFAGALALSSIVFASAPAFATTGVANTGQYVVCTETDSAAVFSVTAPDAGDMIVVTFDKHDGLPSYFPFSPVAGHVVLRDSAVAENITVTLVDAATYAKQAGVTEWPLIVNVSAFPAGTTDFSSGNAINSDYADFGLLESPPGTYSVCTKPELPQSSSAADELPATGTDSTGMAVTGFAALALLVAGGVAVTVRRRRASL